MARTADPDLLHDRGAIAAPDFRGAWRRSAILGLTIAGALLGGLSLLPLSPVMVWNATESAPIGLYCIDHRPPLPGDLVVVEPSGEAAALLRTNGGLAPGRMLLKPLVGVAGDVICRSGAIVSVNGRMVAKALSRASDGRALPHWTGCRRLAAGQLFLVSPHSGSFDGRYFGPIEAARVVGVARPLLTLPPTYKDAH